MKTKHIIALMISILIGLNCVSAQNPVTLHTPRGSNVYAHTRPELMTYTDKLNWSDTVELYYPQATELNAPSATTTYNCHSYAWNMSEGGPTCVLAYYYGDTDESLYWTDNSYVETTEPYASKISYNADDHSAIQTSTQGIYISKWGSLPLMQHSRDYGPSNYQMSYRKYYKLDPYITGSSTALCETQERTFNSNTSITGSTYSCTKDNSYLDYVSGAGTTGYRVEAKNDIDGFAWLLLQITTPSGEVATTPYKYVWVGKPLPSILGPDEVECNSPEWYFADTDSRQWNDYQWSTDYNMDIISVTNGYKAEIEGLEEGYGQIFLEVTNTCGSNENRLVVYVNCSRFLLSPNPASDVVQVLVTNPNPAKITTEDKIPTNYKLSIYDLNGVLYFSNLKSGSGFTFPVSSLKNGNYIVQIIDGKKITNLPLIVKH